MSIALLTGILKIGSKFVEDKDAKAKFAHDAMAMMLKSQTYKWVDALVKLSYAAEQITKGLLRPLGSFALAGFAMYCELNDVDLSETMQAMLYGSPVAWGASRHSEKKNKAKVKRKQTTDEYDWDDDSD